MKNIVLALEILLIEDAWRGIAHIVTSFPARVVPSVYGDMETNMKRAIAVVMLASASTLAHAQWTSQAQTVETYTWGTPVPQKHRRVRPAYVNPPPNYVNSSPTLVNPPAPPPVPQGAIDVTTGQYLPPAAGGVTNPQTGAFYQSVGGGYVNTQNGAFMPAQ